MSTQAPSNFQYNWTLIKNLTNFQFNSISGTLGSHVMFKDEQFLLRLFCKGTVILTNRWKLIMFALAIVSQRVLFLLLLICVYVAFSHPLCWPRLSAAAGGWCVSSSMWFFCQSPPSQSLILYFSASKSSLQASVLSHLDNPSLPSFPLWDERSLMSDKSLDFNPKYIQNYRTSRTFRSVAAIPAIMTFRTPERERLWVIVAIIAR